MKRRLPPAEIERRYRLRATASECEATETKRADRLAYLERLLTILQRLADAHALNLDQVLPIYLNMAKCFPNKLSQEYVDQVHDDIDGAAPELFYDIKRILEIHGDELPGDYHDPLMELCDY